MFKKVFSLFFFISILVLANAMNASGARLPGDDDCHPTNPLLCTDAGTGGGGSGGNW